MSVERLDRFMARANAAYYASHDPFRDFTTAPEISQVFGELLGAWAAVQWEALGRPDPVLLVELGPGRGTLMADALRLARATAPAFAQAARLHFVETSPRLRALLGERFPDARFHEGLGTLPDGPAIVLGNEFLDALPIRQWVRRGAALREVAVTDGARVELPAGLALPAELAEGAGPDAHSSAGAGDVRSRGRGHVASEGAGHVAFRDASHDIARDAGDDMSPDAGDDMSQDMRNAMPQDTPQNTGDDMSDDMREAMSRHMGEGDILERSDAAIAVVTALARRPATIALLVDYGGERPFGDTLQALRGGRPADPFAAPGAADLTAHVDFAGLRTIAQRAGAAVHGPLAQGIFLGRLGLYQRVRRLAATDPGAIEAANRLAQPDRMGLLFKAMAITPSALPVPIGFEAPA